MSRNTLILIGVLIVLGVGSFAATRLTLQSQPAVSEAHVSFQALQDYLEMTPDQRGAMQGIDVQFSQVRPKLATEVLDARDDLLAALQNPDSTPQQALAATKRFCKAQEALQVNTVEYMVALRGHLNADQKDKLAGLVGRGMCALTGGLCHGPGQGRGLGLGLGRGRRGNPDPGCCDGEGWRENRQ